MEVVLKKADLKEVNSIIEYFIENNKETTTSISALLFCLQTLIEGQEKLEIMLNDEEGEHD